MGKLTEYSKEEKMFGLLKRKQKEEVKVKEQSLTQAIENVFPNTTVDLVENEQLQELAEVIRECERLGLKKQGKEALTKYSEITAASVLEKEGMQLLYHERTWMDGDSKFLTVWSDGRYSNTAHLITNGNTAYLSSTPLKEYSTIIPSEVLKRIPTNADLSRMYVLDPRAKDPLLVYHLTGKYYAEICNWE